MGNDDELGLSFFDKSGNVVETKLDVNWLGATLLLVLLGFSSLLKSIFFLFMSLWLVL